MSDKQTKKYQTPCIQKVHVDECLMENYSEKNGNFAKEHTFTEPEDADGANSSPWED